jgi:hypothetical protein
MGEKMGEKGQVRSVCGGGQLVPAAVSRGA